MKKFLIADDHHLILDGLSQAIKNSYADSAVRTVLNKAELDYELGKDQPNILILDVKFGEDNALLFIDELRKQYPDLSILILSSVADQFSVKKLVNSGIKGYVSKSASIVDILNAVRQLLEGHTYFSQEIQEKLTENNDEDIVLTAREKDVLEVILEEKSTKEIAETLNISVKTVEMHRSNLFTKLEVKNVTGLVKKALLLGLLSDKK